MPGTINQAYNNPFEGWVTIREAGEIVNRDHTTIRYWVETGKIVSHRIGSGAVRVVNIEEVKEYSEQANRLTLSKNRRKRKNATK